MTEISSMVISHKKAKIEEMESAWHGDLDALHRSQAGRNMNEIGG